MNPSPSLQHPNRIRQFRLEKGLTQQELAFILGYENASSLSNIETGRQLPSLTTALKLSVALQRLVADIFPNLYEEIREPVVCRRVDLFTRRESQHTNTP
jgi:transcriptional regulator with XRE-family HTH domain